MCPAIYGVEDHGLDGVTTNETESSVTQIKQTDSQLLREFSLGATFPQMTYYAPTRESSDDQQHGEEHGAWNSIYGVDALDENMIKRFC